MQVECPNVNITLSDNILRFYYSAIIMIHRKFDPRFYLMNVIYVAEINLASPLRGGSP